MTQITRLTESEARAQLDQLIALLADAVNNGASVGFLRPLDANLARDYWHDVCASVGKGTKILLIARIDNHIVGPYLAVEHIQKDKIGGRSAIVCAKVGIPCRNVGSRTPSEFQIV